MGRLADRTIGFDIPCLEGPSVGWGSDRDGTASTQGDATALKRFSARPHDFAMAEVAVYIARDSRSAGLGLFLLKRLIASARADGFHSLVAVILEHNTPSLRG